MKIVGVEVTLYPSSFGPAPYTVKEIFTQIATPSRRVRPAPQRGFCPGFPRESSDQITSRMRIARCASGLDLQLWSINFNRSGPSSGVSVTLNVKGDSLDDARYPSTQISMVVDRCCSRPSNHLAQVRVPICSAWAATDVIKVSEIVTGSGVGLATRRLAVFRCAPVESVDCFAGPRSE
jgi:hypothetical protein